MSERGTARHTPGPWRWDADGWIRSDGRGRTDIAEVNFSEEMVSDAPLEEACANATLLAAAPKLLEAAEFLLPFLEAEIVSEENNAAEGIEEASERAADLDSKRAEIRAAIAQARGEG